MYAIPEDFDVTIFVGKTLEQVSFTTNTLTFSFDDDVGIAVESEVWHAGHDDQGDRWLERSPIPVKQSKLMYLLGSSIASVAVDGRATLVLQFANGHTLRCVEDTDQYECYHLRIGDDEIHV
jgi:hypothetical protein